MMPSTSLAFFTLAHLRMSRPDGFAGMEPASAGRTGTVVTKPFDYDGGNLRISADAPAGTVRVGVVGASGLTMETCTPVSGEVTDHVVEWNGKDLRALRGKKIQLSFELKAAKLYSFSFGEES